MDGIAGFVAGGWNAGYRTRRVTPMRMCAAPRDGESSKNAHGNGVPNGKAINANGNGVARNKTNPSEGLDQFVIGYSVDRLGWCSAETEVQAGELAATVLPESGVGRRLTDEDELDVCSSDVESCPEKLTPRVMTPFFVDTFRMSSVYINLFRDTTFVIHIPGCILEEPLFESIMEDLATLSIIGVKLVLVLGPKRQIERRMEESNLEEKFVDGVRVTDEKMLRVIKESAGVLLFEVESKLSRGVVNIPTKNKISVVSGNFYTAQPIGVIDGEDFGHTGKVRRIDVEAIERRLGQRDVVMLSNVAFSPSGESFNCQSEDVAAVCAGQLKAEKLIYLGSNEVIYDTGTKSMVPNLPLRTAKEFLAMNADALQPTFRIRVESCISALSHGVRRAHILNRFVDGVLIMEIFHRDGVGIMISRDLYEGVRPAIISDLPGIFEIIEPLMDRGVLVSRSRDQLEAEIGSMVVAERDGMIIAVASLGKFSDSPEMAELSCFAVHPQYRRSGKGGSLLSYVERIAYAMGIRQLFLLSTQSFAWFRERKFFEVPLDRLPESRKQRYNHQRNSKVLMKDLTESDELEELLIQVQDEV
eukprot:CAMPEP_0184740328 /NCGR_PEP_ID=MMETSP0315-20130426/3350_1 /TAXON_ID=101924 /ORGANISM="Rhodosorus marinus, Strain UTEX LB 2760" /LENGTH=586 /DNA_ID=CAMNT_0027209945 /DNA_START=109 /DNA_END=1869 /DNA_ORIENTATION=+